MIIVQRSYMDISFVTVTIAFSTQFSLVIVYEQCIVVISPPLSDNIIFQCQPVKSYRCPSLRRIIVIIKNIGLCSFVSDRSIDHECVREESMHLLEP